uniref:G_PROTEIN_RECEP_F1_2 domain-containing protein n=1 Tax=Caenorhabditis japonica TaxID=281687 RepID=A0A8R1I346_CAEJA
MNVFFGAICFSLNILLFSVFLSSPTLRKKHRNRVQYYCGRKAAFGNDYATFIYIINIFGYLFSFLINCITMIKASSTINKLVRRQIINVRYSLVISFISFVLVSIPNAISILSVHFEETVSFISKPSTYFTCVNSGINIFVYLLLNAEFRHQFKYLFCNKRRVVTYGEAEKASKGSKQKNHVDLVVHSVHSLA